MVESWSIYILSHLNPFTVPNAIKVYHRGVYIGVCPIHTALYSMYRV